MAEKNYVVYGIPNCDSVKKAFTWLEGQKIAYRFHNYKTEGITKSKLDNWCKQLGWENLINKNSTTWRDLDDAVKNAVTTKAEAIALMQEHTSMIKRPVIELDDKVVVMRFNADTYAETFL